MTRMFSLLLLSITSAVFLLPAEAVPQTVLYQGRLKDAGLHVDGSRDFTVALYAAASGGSALWTENHVAVPVIHGLFQLVLGSTQPIPDAVLAREELWVAVSVGGLVLPRSRLHSTPHARIAGTVPDGAITDSKLDAALLQRLVDLELERSQGWVASRGRKAIGTSSEDLGRGVATDADGNVYVTGYTNGALDGQTSSGNRDIVLIKWNAAGVKQWTRQIGTSDWDVGHGVATDAAGNVYVTGWTEGALDGQVSAGGEDIVLIKWSAAGDMQWTRQIGTSSDDFGVGVATDAAGNIYVTGYTEGALDGQASAGGADIFLIKWNAAGDKQWTRQIDTSSDDYGIGVATDADGNVYVTGYTEGPALAGGLDIVLIKWNAAGDKQWTRQIGTSTTDLGLGVATDADGNVYVTGYTWGALVGHVSAGGFDIILIKWDATGEHKWTRQIGTSTYDLGRGVATDADGNVYVTGYTGGALDGQASAGGNDVVLIKWNAAGDKQWTRQVGTSFQDEGVGIATDAAGNIYVTGDSLGHFAPEPPAGGSDIVLIKFYPNGDRP